MSTIRGRWTTLILHTTAFIYHQKEKLLTAQTLSAFFIVLSIILAEVWLAVISLPLYLITAPTAGNDQETIIFRQRRVMTLSIAAAIFFLWLLKLIFIIWLSFFFDTSARFSISPTDTKKVIEDNMSTVIALAPIDPNLVPPVITKVEQKNGLVVAVGTAAPNSVVSVYYMHDKGANSIHMYQGQSDDQGRWSIAEDHGIFKLPPNTYSLNAVDFSKEKGMKSLPSAPSTITVKANALEQIFTRLDPILNILMLIFVSLGLLALILTL